MHLRRMIIDGQIFSEIDVISKDYDEIKETIKIEPEGEDFNEALAETGATEYRAAGDFLDMLFGPGAPDSFGAMIDFFTNIKAAEQTEINAIEDAVGNEDAAGTILKLIEDMPKTYRRSFCSRLILPMVMAVTANIVITATTVTTVPVAPRNRKDSVYGNRKKRKTGSGHTCIG